MRILAVLAASAAGTGRCPATTASARAPRSPTRITVSLAGDPERITSTGHLVAEDGS